MKKTLAVAVVLSAFAAGAFAQASAPMDAASGSMKHSKMHSSKKMSHKKTDKGAMPASAASGAM